MPTEGAALSGLPQARRPARLLRRPGAARLVPFGLRHCLAQHLGGRGRDRRRPTGGGAGRLCRPPNGIYVVFPQRKHMPLRVRLWIEYLKQQYAQPAFWQGGDDPSPTRPRAPWQTEPMTEPTLLVADDHPCSAPPCCMCCRGACLIPHPGGRQRRHPGPGAARAPEIELVLLDLSMPGARGFSALLHVRGEYPEVPVVIISSTTTPRHPPCAAVWRGRLHPKSAPPTPWAKPSRPCSTAAAGFRPWRPNARSRRRTGRPPRAAHSADRAAVCLTADDLLLNKQIAARTGPGRKHRQGACHRHLEKAGVLQPYAGGGAGESLETEDGGSVLSLPSRLIADEIGSGAYLSSAGSYQNNSEAIVRCAPGG